MSHRVESHPTARAELLRRRAVRDGWLAIVIGLIVPGIALWGARRGWALRGIDARQGTIMMAIGVTVFAVRLALWVGV
jgi:hypothetical protein